VASDVHTCCPVLLLFDCTPSLKQIMEVTHQPPDGIARFVDPSDEVHDAQPVINYGSAKNLVVATNQYGFVFSKVITVGISEWVSADMTDASKTIIPPAIPCERLSRGWMRQTHKVTSITHATSVSHPSREGGGLSMGRTLTSGNAPPTLSSGFTAFRVLAKQCCAPRSSKLSGNIAKLLEARSACTSSSNTMTKENVATSLW